MDQPQPVSKRLAVLTPRNTQLVRIDWEDIQFSDSWGPEEEWPSTKESYLVGHLLVDTPSYLIIGAAYDWQDERWGTLHAIPKLPPLITVVREPDELEDQG